MKKQLLPKSARLIPSKSSREFHLKRNELYTADKFQSYNDWFHFIHIDPYIRWIHAVGMVIGSVLYLICAYKVWVHGFKLDLLLLFFTGVFFFYVLPLISHYIYDGGTAKSSPDRFHSTFGTVIHINLLTLSGRYDSWLRNFVKKYPFTIKAWELEEKDVP